jgi:hypothetical protein
VWGAGAVVILFRGWRVSRRRVQTALRAATAPPQRTIRALDAARRRLGLRHSVDLIASPTCEAPAVVRVLRPMIILPADGCESLDDEELESLLCHECAHVARRDNLLGVFEAVACSVFWFNPLVWLAHRRIAAAREAACDERVADAALSAETYVGALAKICRTLLAPRVPAVSCMASAHIKERIQHLMRYDSLRSSAFSHRAITMMAVLAVFLVVGSAGVVTAGTVATTTPTGPYHLNYALSRSKTGLLNVRVQVIETETKTPLIDNAGLQVKPGEKGTMRVGQTREGDDMESVMTVFANADSSGRIQMLITRNGAVVQDTTVDFAAPGESPRQEFTGAPISLNLSKADIKDVMRAFAQLTGTKIAITPEVVGAVNVNVVDQPWDQAFDSIVRENGYAWRRTEDGGIEVFKP